ncbi:MAG: helix-turn-helix transcriptional regulator [Methylococcaceae bacterium]|jgi:predicted DNA-binding transcriptional regulator AlpA
MLAQTSPGQFWSIDRLITELGVGKSFIYERERRGAFPNRIKLGRRSVWHSDDIQAWKLAQLEGRVWSAE